MSVATRIQEIENHLEDDYNALEGIGADLTNVDKNIVNIANVLNDIYDEMPKVSATGTELTINNTRKGKMITDLQPNTSQDSTSEVIINNIATERGGVNGETGENVTGANRRRIINKVNTTVTEQTLSWSGENIECYVYCYDSNKNYLGYLGNNWSASPYTFTPYNNTAYIRAVFKDSDSLFDDFSNVQLQIENAPLSPQFPIDIHIVTGNNTIKVQNKNLFDISTISAGKYVSMYGTLYDTPNSDTSNYIKVKANQNYIISWDYNTLFNEGTREIGFYNEQKTFLNRITGVSMQDKQKSFTPSQDGYIRFDYDKGCFNVQLEQNSQATTYVSHKEASYPINQGDIEYCVIGDYKDRIFKNVVGDVDYDSTRELGKWYIKKATVDVVLDGTETILDRSDYISAGRFEITSLPLGIEGGASFPGVISTHFKSVYETANGNCYLGTNRHINLVNTDYINNIPGFKTWLSTHNVKVKYVLETPTYILLDNTLQTQLDNIEKMMSYDEQTNISQVNDDLPFILDISALKDISNL